MPKHTEDLLGTAGPWSVTVEARHRQDLSRRTSHVVLGSELAAVQLTSAEALELTGLLKEAVEPDAPRRWHAQSSSFLVEVSEGTAVIVVKRRPLPTQIRVELEDASDLTKLLDDADGYLETLASIDVINIAQA